MNSTGQLNARRGSFGNDYMSRNDYDDWKLELGVLVFDRMLGRRYPVRSVLEVGSNIGLNLWFLNELWREGVDFYAVELVRKTVGRYYPLRPMCGIPLCRS